MNREFTTFEQLVRSFDLIPRKQSTFLIGIDGCGGAGKSTLANKFKDKYSSVTIIHMDDFYFPSSQILKANPENKPIGADFDWERLLDQVLIPLSKNEVGHYQKYDWEKDELTEWYTVPAGGMVIVEGVYVIRKELADKYDFTIWVDCPYETRLLRGLDRDGEEARDRWVNNWMIAEDMYVNEHRPFERADVVMDGENKC